jgi:hypothetical protein
MSDAVREACLMAAAPAATARVAVVSPAAAIRRSRIPVRSTIQASLVSTMRSRSALVSRPSGRAVPHPEIADRTVVAPPPPDMSIPRRGLGRPRPGAG